MATEVTASGRVHMHCSRIVEPLEVYGLLMVAELKEYAEAGYSHVIRELWPLRSMPGRSGLHVQSILEMRSSVISELRLLRFMPAPELKDMYAVVV